MSFIKKFTRQTAPPSVWARPEMPIIFRAEIMPGKSREQRTFRVQKVLRNGRVMLYGFEGEHRESEFEAVNFKRENP
ncbi:MAG: hypothetical protein ACR2HG_15905 [Pyrinomonadaceae bacterium]